MGKLIVLDMAASTLSWNAACILTCISGEMSAAVTNSCLAQSGTSSRSLREPPDARNSIRSSL